MGNVFQSVPFKRPNKTWFDLSHDHKTTLNMGELVPVLTMECLPGDKINLSTEAMLRLMPMVSPIMHKVEVFVHHFFVPNRIMWSNWEKFINPPTTATLPQTFPYMEPASIQDVNPGTLPDYLGLPQGSFALLGADHKVSALPFMAYQMIWWEYYRDQNLQTFSVDTFEDYIKLRNGEQTSDHSTKLTTLRRRAWEHDYFTSCLPFAQKGDAVTLPIEVTVGIDLPVEINPLDPVGPTLVNLDGTPYTTSGVMSVDSEMEGPDGTKLAFDPQGTLRVQGDSSDVSTATTISDLRAAYALQKWFEKSARAGSRYTEALHVWFGVSPEDSRLQRPEYLGGSRSVMAISEVLQTSESADTPQGNMAGHGISMLQGNQCSYFCTEHGYLMSIMSVRPKSSYHQGMPKHFNKFDRLDFFWAEFAHLGEAAVLNKEIYYNNDNDYNTDTFGYLPRYSEYRYLPSRVSGDIAGDLDYWSLHRTLNAPPFLNAGFIECHPSNRIFAVDPDIAGTRSMIAHVYHSLRAQRVVPLYGEPLGLM